MKKIILLGICLILVFSQAVIAEDNHMLVTREEFVAKSSYSLEETADIDIEGLIEARRINKFLLNLMTESIVDAYIFNLKNDYPISYTLPEGQNADPEGFTMQADVDWVALCVEDDAAATSIVIDFANNRVYYDPQRFIWENVCYAEYKAQLSDEQSEACAALLRDSGYAKWASEYPSEDDTQRGRVFGMLVCAGDTYAQYVSTSLNTSAPIDEQVDLLLGLTQVCFS